jgi:hypothetical protein
MNSGFHAALALLCVKICRSWVAKEAVGMTGVVETGDKT